MLRRIPRASRSPGAPSSPSQFRDLSQIAAGGEGGPAAKARPARHCHRAELYRHQRGVWQRPINIRIQAVRENIESNVVGPETITPADIFPPAVPSGLTASVGMGAVELAWNRNTEAYFQGISRFALGRRRPVCRGRARDWKGPSTPITQCKSGKHYRYQIVAVGQNGRSSAPCEPVEITAQ